MKNIFTYGSLMFEPVWSNIVTGQYTSVGACLNGFVRKQVKRAEYPAIAPMPRAEVLGVVYFDVKGVDLKRLDEFEGAIYSREEVTVSTSSGDVLAGAYVLRSQYRHLLSSLDWSPELFEARDMRRFMQRTLGLR